MTLLPGDLNENWDSLAAFYYQKKEFLTYLHNYNYCNQRYYELFIDGTLEAGTVVYTFRTNILTFTGLKMFVNMEIIGLPVSIATVPLVGNESEHENLLEGILKREKGLIMGLNLRKRYLEGTVINMRTLPTIVIDKLFKSYGEYLGSLRSPYRRRLNRFAGKFANVRSRVSSCSEFTDTHYMLYLDVMKRASGKLETLSQQFFMNLPANFILTTHYADDTILAWNICHTDGQTLFFFMGGLNYKFRDQYQAYHNNLYGIFKYAYTGAFRRIDLGQTAETAKMRAGGVAEERVLFLWHRNILLMFILKLFRRMLEYSSSQQLMHVFRD
ncbi:MAG: GNAT family N-acetyltransferase [Bacteroidales bacterium]|nr:GNAT family N-acetyltransferase [Bacteroidales bacterium]